MKKMKKTILLSLLIITSLTSCNKQNYCTCTVNGTIKTETERIYNTRRQAKKNCEESSKNGKTCYLEAY